MNQVSKWKNSGLHSQRRKRQKHQDGFFLTEIGLCTTLLKLIKNGLFQLYQGNLHN